ncbi:polysaccharide deacetylase family protein [Candidatus Woesearchaeota archaeon]|nr:polysaccharide deacetylase family protein [Candidatus Woesearchaeota archaeon]
MTMTTSIPKVFVFSTLFFLISFSVVTPKTVLLSFDVETGVGDEEATKKILEVLDEEGVKATFFVMGSFAEKNPETLLSMLRGGHEIACHTQNHALLLFLKKEEVREEIVNCKVIVEEIIGEEIIGFRAPWRLTNKEVFEVLDEENFYYDASFYENIPRLFLSVGEVRTSMIIGFIFSDDHFFLNVLNFPSPFYFGLLSNIYDERVSLAFHPHNIEDDLTLLEELINTYKQRNVEFKTHKEII